MTKCSLCGSDDGVRRYAVTVDGKEVRLTAKLCDNHGTDYLYRIGVALGSIVKPDPVDGSHLVKVANVLVTMLADEGFTASDALVIFDIALRAGRNEAPREMAERCAGVTDAIMALAGVTKVLS